MLSDQGIFFVIFQENYQVMTILSWWVEYSQKKFFMILKFKTKINFSQGQIFLSTLYVHTSLIAAECLENIITIDIHVFIRLWNENIVESLTSEI